MQCKCCMKSMESDRAVCPVCGFSALGNPKQSDVEDFRSLRLRGINISVKVYYYEKNSVGDLEEKKSEYITVANASQLRYREVFWLEKEFESFDVDHDIELDVGIFNGSENIHATLSAAIKNPLTCARLGLWIDDGFVVHLVVGSKEQFVYSQGVALISKKVD